MQKSTTPGFEMEKDKMNVLKYALEHTISSMKSKWFVQLVWKFADR
jgi:hypothetical protein